MEFSDKEYGKIIEKVGLIIFLAALCFRLLIEIGIEPITSLETITWIVLFSVGGFMYLLSDFIMKGIQESRPT